MTRAQYNYHRWLPRYLNYMAEKSADDCARVKFGSMTWQRYVNVHARACKQYLRAQRLLISMQTKAPNLP